MIYIETTDGRVNFIHHNPLDENLGMGLTQDELERRGFLTESQIPIPENQNGFEPILYYDKNKGFFFKYIDIGENMELDDLKPYKVNFIENECDKYLKSNPLSYANEFNDKYHINIDDKSYNDIIISLMSKNLSNEIESEEDVMIQIPTTSGQLLKFSIDDATSLLHNIEELRNPILEYKSKLIQKVNSYQSKELILMMSFDFRSKDLRYNEVYES